jgi:hypothetical protein
MRKAGVKVGSRNAEVRSLDAEFARLSRLSSRDGGQGLGIDDELAHWLLFHDT